MNTSSITDLLHRLEQIEGLLRKGPAKPFYSADEFAAMVDRVPYTVRDWCKTGRVNASRSLTRAGPTLRWVISHDEYVRYLREGLLPERLVESNAA